MADEGDDATPDIGGVIAIALGVIAWVSFLLAFFMADEPLWFLLFALVCGGVALAVGLRARREEQAAAAVGGAAAGAALLWGVSVVAALTAMVYATGVLLFLVMLFFLAIATGASSSGGSCGGSSGSSSGGGCCCDDCCDGCCTSACDCGCGSCCDCGCGSCCDCGGCDCGGCGGCGCIGFGMVLAPTRALRHDRFAHHPDTPEFAADVYVVRGLRWCIGCFTTYPVFLVATALLIAFTPASTPALLVGIALALVQVVSSAGLARTRLLKALVKTCLGLGLALVVSGIHSAAWPPALKVGALLATLALAFASTIPRSRRMRRARGACAHDHEAIARGVATNAPR